MDKLPDECGGAGCPNPDDATLGCDAPNPGAGAIKAAPADELGYPEPKPGALGDPKPAAGPLGWDVAPKPIDGEWDAECDGPNPDEPGAT